MTKQYKSFDFEVKQIKEKEGFFIFEGFASTFGNVDLGDDIVQRGAFADSLKENSQVPILWQHRMSEPIGKSIHLEEQEKGLFVQARLPKDDSLVRDRVIPQMKVGSITTMSIGFFTVEFSRNNDTGINTLEKVKLFEISLVTLAMNPKAEITDFKSFKEIEKDVKSLKDIETYLKSSGLSNNESKALISKIKEFSKDQREADDSDKTKEQCDVAKLNKIADLQFKHKLQKINNLIKN